MMNRVRRKRCLCYKKFQKIAESNREKVKEQLEKAKASGGFNAKQMWKLKKKICPKFKDPPTAMFDGHGNLLTEDKAIMERGLEVYKKRLEGNQIAEHLEEHESKTIELCKTRLKRCKFIKTNPWEMEDLDFVLKELKKEKSKDAEGYTNELFTLTVAGSDLKLALLKLLNLIKDKQQFPQAFEKCNITPIHKNHSKNDFENYRGIFRITVIRSILDRLMYNDEYFTIDGNLTDGNVGARKERSCRDNIFVIDAISNSVINGKSPSTQVEVIDVKTCFDKLWLEASINAIYEAGVQNYHLNLLYIENNNAQIAVKINGKTSRRINVQNVIMQGSIWGSLKCTTQMDKLNKICKENNSLQYKYKGDENITIGVLGMVDDTLVPAECGVTSVEKNAVVNSFIESHRLELHREKSKVVHIGRKCRTQCPKLKVHDEIMQEAHSVKYLGNVLTNKGIAKATIEDRRAKGWGKVSAIKAILSQVTFGSHRVEVGLMLRKSILISSLLFSAEAWSNVSVKDVKRLEQVDTALISHLVNGHAKCPTVFHYLETGSLMIRHILTYLRLLYHHHILSRNENETLNKIYHKQKELQTRGDWYQLIKKDFEFIELDINEEEIRATPKSEYKKKIKKLVQQAAFKYYMKEKDKMTKLDKLEYTQLKLQTYLTEKTTTNKEKYLLYSLRSRSHEAKVNFKNMNKHDLQCRFGCKTNESQEHIFIQCTKLKEASQMPQNIDYEDIFKDVSRQTNAIKAFILIEATREDLKKKLLPGGEDARTLAGTTSTMQQM